MELQTEPIALLYSAEEASKTDALSEGDQVTVFASVDGTQNYLLENSRWTVASDGKTLVPPQAVFYPDSKQAVSFWAYFGTQSVPSDQSTAAALKQADLCWASASSTPSHAPVPLAFSHVFARLVVTCSQPTAKITAINAFSGGTLDIRSGAFANTTKSDVFTAQNELIVPAQTLNRLILTSGGVDYVFDGSIALESGKTTSVNLTLNASTRTASLNGSSVSDWTSSSQNGNLSESVSNVLTLHWPAYVPQGTTPNKVALTVNGSDYTVSSGIGYANQTFTVPFASSALRYPYTISKITFYSGSTQALPTCTQLLGATIYKSTATTLGIKDPANAVLINGIWWATGNLVADGPNGCRIGAPTDCGLYFQFGSLIGWSGGAAPNNNGTGAWSNHTAMIKVKPANLNATYDPGAVWPTGASTTGLNKPYFSVTTEPYLTQTPSISGYAGAPTSGTGVDLNQPNLGKGRYAPMGVGDPCTFYLGANWRMPNVSDMKATTGITIPKAWTAPTSCTFNLQPTGLTITKGAAQISFPVCYDRASASVWASAQNLRYWGDIWLDVTLSTYGGVPMVVQSCSQPNSNEQGNAMWTLNGGGNHDNGTNSTHGLVVRCVASN